MRSPINVQKEPNTQASGQTDKILILLAHLHQLCGKITHKQNRQKQTNKHTCKQKYQYLCLTCPNLVARSPMNRQKQTNERTNRHPNISVPLPHLLQFSGEVPDEQTEKKQKNEQTDKQKKISTSVSLAPVQWLGPRRALAGMPYNTSCAGPCGSCGW